MRLWIDDVRPAPKGYIWCRTVKETITIIKSYEHNMSDDQIIIDLDHDAGDFARDGGDYINILNKLEEMGIVDTGYFFISIR